VGRALAGEIRVGFDSLAQAIERVRWLDVHADQVLGRQVKVVFPDLDPGAIQLGGE
jgi:hypothetical protein